MTLSTLTEIENVFEKISTREKKLPGYWGTASCGTTLFNAALLIAHNIRNQQPLNQDAYKLSIQCLNGFVRIVNHVLDEVKKKPEQAFINYNVMCELYSRSLNEGISYEAAIQTATRKAHTVIANAKKDKSHWLRNTNCWKKLFQ